MVSGTLTASLVVVCDCASVCVQLNATKIELIWFGCRAALLSHCPAITINDVVLQLGVLLDMSPESPAPASLISAVLGNLSDMSLQMQWSIWLQLWSSVDFIGLLQLSACWSTVKFIESRLQSPLDGTRKHSVIELLID